MSNMPLYNKYKIYQNKCIKYNLSYYHVYYIRLNLGKY